MDRSSIRWKTISELCKPHLILMDIREQSCHNIAMTETKDCKGSSTHQPENKSDLKDVKLKGLKKLFSKLRSRIHRTNSEVAQCGSDGQRANVNDNADRYKVLGSLVNFSRNPSLCETYETRRSQMTEHISSPTWLFERSHYSPCSGPVSIQSEGAFCARPSALQSPPTSATTDDFEDILKGFGLKRHKSCVNRPNTLRLKRRPTTNRLNRLLNENKSTKVDLKTPVESREEAKTIQTEPKEQCNSNNSQNKWKTLTEMKLLRAKDDALSDHVGPSPAGQTNWEEKQAKVVTIFTRTAKRRIRYGRKEPSSSFSFDDGELTDEQRGELKKAFKMFEKSGKGKMPARNLGSLLRCLGWNPSERELEEARHELDISARGSMSFAEVERYVAHRGGIYNGSKEEEDISEAFQMLGQCETGKISVKKFKYFMTNLGEKMTDEEVEEFLGFMKKDGVAFIECKDLIQALQNFDLSS